MKSLLLGKNGRILKVIDWKDAILLAYFRNGVAFGLEYHDREVYSSYCSFKIPSVLMLQGNRDRYPNYDVLPLTRTHVFIRDEYRCQYCGKEISETSGTIDHIFPLGRKGTNTWRNVVAACARCNRMKDRLTADEFEEKYGIRLMRRAFVPNRGILFKHFLDKPGYEAWRPYLMNMLKKVKEPIFENMTA